MRWRSVVLMLMCVLLIFELLSTFIWTEALFCSRLRESAIAMKKRILLSNDVLATLSMIISSQCAPYLSLAGLCNRQHSRDVMANIICELSTLLDEHHHSKFLKLLDLQPLLEH